MRLNKPAMLIAVTMMCSTNSNADGNNAATKKAESMIQAVEALAGEARLHHQARQRLIDASSLVERRAAIIEFQAKCQKHGYSCIQPGDFNRITLSPSGMPKARDDSPSDSSTLQKLMGNGGGRKDRVPGKNDGGNNMAAHPALQFSSNITWLGHTHNTVTLNINGQKVTAVLDQKIPGTPYTVRKIRPYKIVLGDQTGGIRVVPVVWPSGNDGSGNRQQNSGFPQFQMPSSPADSSMQLPLGRPPRAS